MSSRATRTSTAPHRRAPDALLLDHGERHEGDHESFYDVGVFVDPTEALRFGVDYAHIDDVYADKVKAKNDSGQLSSFLFF